MNGVHGVSAMAFASVSMVNVVVISAIVTGIGNVTLHLLVMEGKTAGAFRGRERNAVVSHVLLLNLNILLAEVSHFNK